MAQTAEALAVDASVSSSQIRHEVPSSITVATLGAQPRLSIADGEAAIREFLRLDLLLTDDASLAVSAPYLVHQLKIAYYDALDVALAQRYAIPFVTADNKLFVRVRRLPGMLWFGNWRLTGG